VNHFVASSLNAGLCPIIEGFRKQIHNDDLGDKLAVRASG
jgi:hypothetical protein